MNHTPEGNQEALFTAKRELARIDEEALKAQATLMRLKEALSHAQERLSETQKQCNLLDANEHLVVEIMRLHSDAETTAKTLDQVVHFADLDELTNLPNRRRLLERIERSIGHSIRHDDGFALLFLDVNGFKYINDKLGHATGDLVLKKIAQCLTTAVRETDTVSRYGGDEFLILLSNVSRKSDAMSVADKILSTFGSPHPIGDQSLRLSVSIGISVYPEDGTNPQTLIEKADVAMYQAKRAGPGKFQFHGEQVPGFLGPTPGNTVDRHVEIMCEANEQLVMAALGAQKLQSDAEHALQQQKDRLAREAHELRNPLTPLSQTAGLLARVKLADLPRIQATIEQQVRHMSRLVEDPLDMTHVDAGKLRLDLQSIDLNNVINEAVGSCRPSMDIRFQYLKVQLCEPPVFIEGDAVRLAQVFCNLLGNASKYTPKHGALSLSMRKIEQNVEIVVADSGIGMTAQMLPLIFDPYVQDITAMRFNCAGLGIGLTVVRELVQAHHGSVEAKSGGLDLGSQFIIILPLAGLLESI